MKTERNILVAFILNLAFSVFEFIGGTVTGSVAILSDSIHDLGDALSIGISYIFEKKSSKKPDTEYTYGYARFSVMGGMITTVVLIVGSIGVIYGAIMRLIHPVAINYNGMIIFGIVGVIVNTLAAFVTKDGDSVNQKAVNLHMLEDVLGWIIVLIGAVIMRFTDISIIDPLMSIGVSSFILVNAVKNFIAVVEIFLEKKPSSVNTDEIKEHLMEIEGVLGVHHIHIWTMDGNSNFATLHVVTDKDSHTVKAEIREELKEHSIGHCTIETERPDEHCEERDCHVEFHPTESHHHHHH